MATPRSEAVEDDAEPGPFVPAPRRGHLRQDAPVLAVVAVGGVIGACGRYGAALLWPTAPTAFPWTTLGINVTGCALMGILMALVTEVWPGRRLLRPFVGTGILGGYTTFSTYATDVQHLVNTGHATAGLAYLVLTLAAALSATWVSAALTRRAITRRAR